MKWIARIKSVNKEGIITYTNLDTHACTEKDFADFYPLKEVD